MNNLEMWTQCRAFKSNDTFRVVCNPLCMLEIFLATENWVANLKSDFGVG